jgi:3-oxoacyl-[acyl-carrier-protein] synthase III
VVLHQPNGQLLSVLIERLCIDPARTLNVVSEIGSVGAVSVPFGLDRLLRSRPVQPGERILMASVGAGTTYGAILYEVGT